MNELQGIKSLIYEIRGLQVMLDADLAGIYRVETKVLNQAVKRNIERFPPEFMFQLTEEEYEILICQIGISSLRSQIVTSNLRSQIAISKGGRGGRRYMPFVFTEHGIIMLSSVLNSKIAAGINIAVVRAFIDMRRYIAKPVREKLSDLEKVLMLHIDDTNHNFAKQAAKINEIIKHLGNIVEAPPKPRRKIGFQPD